MQIEAARMGRIGAVLVQGWFIGVSADGQGFDTKAIACEFDGRSVGGLVRIQDDRRFTFGKQEDRVEGLLPLGVAKGVASRVRGEDSQESSVQESDRKTAGAGIEMQGIEQRV